MFQLQLGCWQPMAPRNVLPTATQQEIGLQWASGTYQKAGLVCDLHLHPSWEASLVVASCLLDMSEPFNWSVVLSQGHHSSSGLLSPWCRVCTVHQGVYALPWFVLCSLPAGGPAHRKRPQSECHALHCFACLQLCPQGHHKPVQQPLWPLFLWKHLQLQQCLGVKDSSQWTRDKWQSVSRPWLLP